MNLTETADLLVLVAMLDNRKIDEGTVEMWHAIVGGYEFEDCKTALINARQRDDITWLEPKHIVSEVRKLKERRTIDERRERALSDKPEAEAKEMPICQHGIGVVKCDRCCALIWKNHQQYHAGQQHGDAQCMAFIKSLSVN